MRPWLNLKFYHQTIVKSHKDYSVIPSDFVQELLQRESPEWEKVIEKDLSRTFPFHELFREKDGPG